MSGRGGDDHLRGFGGGDALWGGLGDDRLEGDEGDDTADSGGGNDHLEGGAGFNILRGRGGDDWVQTNADGGWARGDAGDDILFGGRGGGYHRLEAGPGDDEVWAVAEAVPGQAFDVITGRGADDVHAFARLDGFRAEAHVRDFTVGQDQLALTLEQWMPTEPYRVEVDTAELFDGLDSDDNGVLDGSDSASAYGSSFALGSGEHGIRIWVGDDVLVVHLPDGTDALSVNDFLL